MANTEHEFWTQRSDAAFAEYKLNHPEYHEPPPMQTLDDAADHQRAATGSSGDAALNDVAAQFKLQTEGRGARSIHELAYGADVEVDRQPEEVEPEDFDQAKFERAYGLPAGYLDGVTTLDEANKGLACYTGDDVTTAHATAVCEAQISDSLQELGRRIDAHYDSWNSPKYGHSSKALTDAQAIEREKLARAVSLHSEALGGSLPRIEALLNRARLATDKDWKPSFKKPQKFRSIHEAYQHNRS